MTTDAGTNGLSILSPVRHDFYREEQAFSRGAEGKERGARTHSLPVLVV